MLTEDIRKESDRLKDQYKAFRKFWIPSQFCGITFGILIFTFLGSQGTEYDKTPDIENIRLVIGILTLIFLTAAITLYVFSYRKYGLSNSEIAIVGLYNSHLIIDDYLQRSKFEPNLKKAKKNLNSVNYQIAKDWESNKNTVIFEKVPGLTTFLLALKNIEDAIDNKEKLLDFQGFLVDMIKFLLYEDNVDSFLTLKNKLEKFIPIEKKQTKNLNKILTNYPKLKHMWIPPAAGIIIFMVLNSVDSTQRYTSLATSLIIASGALFAILFKDRINLRN